jgi:alpha-beta hydrolase superfamily lysophospholipase
MMRRIAPLVLLLLLAACAGSDLDQPAFGGASVDTGRERLADHWLIAADGTELPLRVWLPDGRPKAVILALHGMNDYSNAFAAPGAAWARMGIATYAYDQRGFGEAPVRGLWPGSWQLAEDVATASTLLHRRYPGVPLYLLGESMGGAVAITAVTGTAGAPRPAVEGIVLAAPAVWGRETMTLLERLALWTGDRLFPGATFTGAGLGIMPSDNIDMLRGLSRDPLVIKETRVDAIKGTVDLMDLALASASRVDVPMLLLYGEHDQIVPPEPTALWVRSLPFDERFNRRLAWYDKGYHILLRDLEAPVVWRDVASWMGDHHAPLPSGADRRASDVFYADRATTPFVSTTPKTANHAQN